MTELRQKMVSDLRARGVFSSDPELREEAVDKMLASKKVSITEDDWDAVILFMDDLFGATPAKRAANLEELACRPEVWIDMLAGSKDAKSASRQEYPNAGQWDPPSGAVENCIREGCGAKVVKRFHRSIRTDLNGKWVCPACGVEYFGGYVGGYPVAMWDKDRPLWLGTTKEECLP